MPALTDRGLVYLGLGLRKPLIHRPVTYYATPPVDIYNTAEGYSADGTVVDTSNSGDGSGTAFASVIAGAAASSTERTREGTYSYKVAALTGTQGMLRLDNVSSDMAVGQFFVYLTGYTTSACHWIRFEKSNGVLVAQGVMNTNGTVSLRGTANTTLATTAGVIPLNQWARVVLGANRLNGNAFISVYDTDDVTEVASTAVTGADLGFAAFPRFVVGKASSAGNMADYWIDNISFGAFRVADYEPLTDEPISLTVDAADQTQTADELALTQDHLLAVADAGQAQTADEVALTQVHVLTVQDAEHAQSADNPALTVVTPLTVADAAHAQTADSLDLTQVHQLAVQDAGQAQTVDGPALTQVHQLAVAEAAQLQSADSLNLAQVHSLAVQDAAHTQTADSLVLVVGGISLTVQDGTHTQTADAVALTQDHQLPVDDARQDQTADDVELAQVHQLTVQDAQHAQTVGNVPLGVTLVVDDATHAQTADNVTISESAGRDITITVGPILPPRWTGGTSADRWATTSTAQRWS